MEQKGIEALASAVICDMDEWTSKQYEEVCKSYLALREYRAKLLALVPLATAALIALGLPKQPMPGESHSIIVALGTYGVLVSLGLYGYEMGNMKKLESLIQLGRDIEVESGLTNGQFIGRWERTHAKTLKAKIMNYSTAAIFVYGSTVLAWSFIAASALAK